MKCLAVNTATAYLSIALVDGDDVLYRFQTDDTRQQGNILMAHVGEALQKNSLTYQDINLLAVVTGPGSFTGIRIGLAAIRGIALAASLPVMGVSSFDMFFEPKEDSVNVIAVESWRDELYFAVKDYAGTDLIAPVNETPEDFAQRMKNINLPLVVSGDAASKIAPFFLSAEIRHQLNDAVHVAQIAVNRYTKDGKTEKPIPFYLRPPDITVVRK